MIDDLQFVLGRELAVAACGSEAIVVVVELEMIIYHILALGDRDGAFPAIVGLEGPPHGVGLGADHDRRIDGFVAEGLLLGSQFHLDGIDARIVARDLGRGEIGDRGVRAPGKAEREKRYR